MMDKKENNLIRLSGTYYLNKEAIEKRRRKGWAYLGAFYPTVWCIAKEFSIPSSVAVARADLGWKVEDIVNKPWGVHRWKLK